MVTQEFVSDLWTPVLAYKNEAVFQSHNADSTPRASTTLTVQASNPAISMGNSVNGYRAPVQFIRVLPPSIPPRFRERNTMNPLLQQQTNIAMEKIAVPDPRMNITGNYVKTTQKLENMGIQTAPFNYNAIFGIVGILAGIVAIVWLARRRKLARLTFSNVPTATGGVISGNIGIGAGSPFGAGGKYEAQVSNIKATIAKAPKGFYDPVGWDDFLRKKELYSEQLPEGVRFYEADDPELMEELLQIPSARQAMIDLKNLGLGHNDRLWEACGGGTNGHNCEIRLRPLIANYYSIIALYVNKLMLEKNAPAIQAIEEHERQLEIDQAVKIAMDEKVRATAKAKSEAVPVARADFIQARTPASTISILPIIIIAVALIGVLLFLRRKA